MKLSKQQIKQIVKKEIKQIFEGDGHYGLGAARPDSAMSSLPDDSLNLNAKMMQEKAMDIIMAMEPDELAQLLKTPMMQMAFERLMGMGKY